MHALHSILDSGPVLVKLSLSVINLSLYRTRLIAASKRRTKLLKKRWNATIKVGFHYPSSRAEFTGRVDGCGCQKMHPSSRAVNSARQLG